MSLYNTKGKIDNTRSPIESWEGSARAFISLMIRCNLSAKSTIAVGVLRKKKHVKRALFDCDRGVDRFARQRAAGINRDKIESAATRSGGEVAAAEGEGDVVEPRGLHRGGDRLMMRFEATRIYTGICCMLRGAFRYTG